MRRENRRDRKTINDMRQIPPSGFPYTRCSSSGEDEFGIWLEFTVKSAVQRMRWIKPGQFSMGSPYDELHRHHYESQHEVTLRKGFWISDTACSQELFQVVMETNPSKNNGAKRPVENVSWDDCSEFLRRVNSIIRDFSLSLPTEGSIKEKDYIIVPAKEELTMRNTILPKDEA